MSIYYVRHGQTEWNRLGKYQGTCDISLNDIGIDQAKQTKKCLDQVTFDVVICSPLQRAIETAEIIVGLQDIEIIVDERLIERSFGCFEGCQASDIVNDLWVYQEQAPYEGSESTMQFFKRVYACMDDIVKTIGTKNILIVAHGGVGIPVQCYFQDIDLKKDLTYLIPKNCEIITIETYDKKTVLPSKVYG